MSRIIIDPQGELSLKKSLSLVNQRILSLSYLIYLGFFLITIRAIYLQTFSASEKTLEKLASHQYQSEISLSPDRGYIFDKKYSPLAMSIKKPSIAMNPRAFKANKEQIQKISKILQMDSKKLFALSKQEKYFVWLKRKATFDQWTKLKKLKIKGLHMLLEPDRYYPEGSIGSHIVGYTGVDNNGLLGVELAFEKNLRGQKDKVMNFRDARGNNIIFNKDLLIPQKSGDHIILTIDKAIQEITEKALYTGIQKSNAPRGFAIVADPNTGRVLAAANHPNFDPNDSKNLNINHTKNLAINYRFEPGSILKPLIIAAVLEENLTTLSQVHYCEKNGKLKISPNVYIHDDHPKDFLTTEEILTNSSNICTFKLAQKLGPQKTYEYLKNFGVAKKSTYTHLPGESQGELSSWQDWRPIRFANISFGQGLFVTGLEIIKAYSAIANGGLLVDPFFVSRIENHAHETLVDFRPTINKRVIRKEVSLQLKSMLKKVVTNGTGTNAALNGFSSSGKTGTAQKINPETKSYSLRIANFVGFAPAEDPHLVIFVLIDEPGHQKAYGGLWAAPVFKEIAEKTLKYLNVEQSPTYATLDHQKANL